MSLEKVAVLQTGLVIDGALGFLWRGKLSPPLERFEEVGGRRQNIDDELCREEFHGGFKGSGGWAWP